MAAWKLTPTIITYKCYTFPETLDYFTDDFWVARRKLAEYYSKSCTDSRLVADPSSKSKVPQLHVPILWRRLIKDRTAVQDEILDAYYKIFAKVSPTGLMIHENKTIPEDNS